MLLPYNLHPSASEDPTSRSCRIARQRRNSHIQAYHRIPIRARPQGSNPHEMGIMFSRLLITKRYIVSACKTWNELTITSPYGAVLRNGRGISGVLWAFRGSLQRNAGVWPGHHVRRIDLSVRDSRTHRLSLKQAAEREEIADVLR